MKANKFAQVLDENEARAVVKAIAEIHGMALVASALEQFCRLKADQMPGSAYAQYVEPLGTFRRQAKEDGV